MTDPRAGIWAFMRGLKAAPAGSLDQAEVDRGNLLLDELGAASLSDAPVSPPAVPSPPVPPGPAPPQGGQQAQPWWKIAPVLDPDIGMIDAELIAIACPAVLKADLAQWVEPIRKACVEFEINTIRRVAAFIAQMAHESTCFTRTSENLNYRAERLTQVWPSRFPSLAAAAPYAGNPEKLANKVYANRIGNGDEASGDGWRFRGGGPLQLTGRANWQGFADGIGMPLDQAVAYGRTIEGGVMAAAWFWEENDINRLADTPGVADESKRINGGDIGLADRKKKFDALVAEMLRRGAAA